MSKAAVYDAIIVGFGIAGVAVARQLECSGKQVCVVDAGMEKASTVAAGLYNPVNLKRFTLAWNAHEQMSYAQTFYTNLQKFLGVTFDQKLPVYRKFASVEEQNEWFRRADRPVLENYLNTTLRPSLTSAIKTPLQNGLVSHTGRINMKMLINAYADHFKAKDSWVEEVFDYSQLKASSYEISYKQLRAKRIIFCEGHGLKINPYFNYLPLIGNKGSYLIIASKALKLSAALKSRFFLIPLGEDRYKFGATYENHFKSGGEITSRKLLEEELDKLVDVPYTIIKEQTGIRPTVKDRRPLVGTHPVSKNVHVFNGMGTRGVLIAPTAAKQLCEALCTQASLPAEIDIQRYAKLWKGRTP